MTMNPHEITSSPKWWVNHDGDNLYIDYSRYLLDPAPNEGLYVRATVTLCLEAEATHAAYVVYEIGQFNGSSDDEHKHYYRNLTLSQAQQLLHAMA